MASRYMKDIMSPGVNFGKILWREVSLLSTRDGRRHARAIREYRGNPANPFLVSFPRTGSHWLRMVLECYFERPQLRLSFIYKDRTDYFLYHSHDESLRLRHANVMYLLRNPVDTVYSTLCYHGENLEDVKRVRYWSDRYGAHLHKWLVDERFTKQKTIITYERLKSRPNDEFASAIAHLGGELDTAKLRTSLAAADKARVKSKTSHDPRVIRIGGGYHERRDRFREQHSAIVWGAVLKDRGELVHFLSATTAQPDSSTTAEDSDAADRSR